MNGHTSSHAVVPHGHGHGEKSALGMLLHLFTKLKNLGIAGYALEALLELGHTSKRAHHRFHFLHKPWVHLLAILMILTGHLAEHVHQEEENHHQEARLADLEAKVAALGAAKKAIEEGARRAEVTRRAPTAHGVFRFKALRSRPPLAGAVASPHTLLRRADTLAFAQLPRVE
eukprot:CAMPEP_0170398196 /NCGR_PEP_ID=MMETSP0117_2-20130122/23274_1 /TAXON_ID=400756 /ORGANISM="Durinskia baltica, Strain CSIRO CS-38" /LENGTH=172 /DNA_ID=CAMNT_0010654739 /DNA_START=103 /DNA_END=619 /DNA_ORIENTATION=-